MHIPDGFLSAPVCIGTAVVAGGGLAVAVRCVRGQLENRLVPLMGVLAAFVFAAQMFNFPVAAGTSGHLLGGVLVAVLVGPMAATIVLSVVLIVQCLLFQDGGLTALGANVLNMAIVGTWGGWALSVLLAGWKGRMRTAGTFLGAWASVVLASAACALELTWSGTVSARPALVAMVGVHSLIGIGEGVITVLVVSFVARVRPDLLRSRRDAPGAPISC